ncbi:hypothetical protein HYV72_00735 [Candidatus Uhrbacteria bacterium]|nr:hypothetical protein [Candidatus Uhrbacteria bacterium]
MYFWIGIPLMLVVATVFGAFMAKRKGSVGVGKVYGFLLLAIFVAFYLTIYAFIRN